MQEDVYKNNKKILGTDLIRLAGAAKLRNPDLRYFLGRQYKQSYFGKDKALPVECITTCLMVRFLHRHLQLLENPVMIPKNSPVDLVARLAAEAIDPTPGEMAGLLGVSYSSGYRFKDAGALEAREGSSRNIVRAATTLIEAIDLYGVKAYHDWTDVVYAECMVREQSSAISSGWSTATPKTEVTPETEAA